MHLTTESSNNKLIKLSQSFNQLTNDSKLLLGLHAENSFVHIACDTDTPDELQDDIQFLF